MDYIMKQKFKFHQEDVDDLVDTLGCPETIESLFKIEFPDINGIFPNDIKLEDWEDYMLTGNCDGCDFSIFRKDGKLFKNKWFYFEIDFDESNTPFNAKIMSK